MITATRTYRNEELYPEAFEARGYRRFDSQVKPHSNGFYQKLFKDKKGMKYSIEFFEYDWAQFNYHPTKDISYEACAQFNCDDDITFNVEYLTRIEDTIESIENFFESVYLKMNCCHSDEYDT